MANILLIDGDPYLGRLYSDMLTQAGHRVSYAGKSPEITALLSSEQSYDVALVELAFAFEMGLKVIEKLRQDKRPPEVLGITKAGEPALIQAALKLGVVDFLHKPIEGDHLTLLLQRVLERRQLSQEASRLIGENLLNLGVQKIFKDGLVVLRTLEETALYERLLQTTSVNTDCQGIALYVAKRTHLELEGYYGLIAGDKLPPSLALSAFDLNKTTVEPRVIPVDDPLAIQRGESPKRVNPAEARGLVFVLAQDQQPEGVVIANARLGHPFSEADLTRAQLLSEVASVAVSNARRFAQERKKALQSRQSSTYNISFFVDYLGKELHKARRYRRSFAMVQLVFDNYPGLAAELGPKRTEKLIMDIERVLPDVLRESDVLSRAADNEYLIVLPEADVYGARMTIARIEQALGRDHQLAEAQKNLTLGVTPAWACFPHDGADIDSLMAASRRRLDEVRKSAYRKLHLEEASFYDASQLLLAKNSPMRKLIEAPVDYAYTQMTPAEVSAWVRELLLASQALHSSHSALYWGVPEISQDIIEAIAPVVRAPLAGSPNRFFLLGAKDAGVSKIPAGVTSVYVDFERATRMGFLFSLSESHAYALLGENLNIAPTEAFHTSDTHLALGLARKLQQEYNLQRWL